jgi:hypothetical protein
MRYVSKFLEIVAEKLSFLDWEERLEEKYRLLNEKAYYGQLKELRSRFPSEYVAFVDGKLVDHDIDLTALSMRVERVEPNRWKRFYARTDVDYRARATIF